MSGRLIVAVPRAPVEKGLLLLPKPEFRPAGRKRKKQPSAAFCHSIRKLAAQFCNTIRFVVTTLPSTTYAQNNGVIALTRCASRWAGIACGVWLFLFGVLAKVGAWVTTIPNWCVSAREKALRV